MGEREHVVTPDVPVAAPAARTSAAVPSTVAAVLALQRSAGNQATAQLLRDAKQVAVTGVTLSAPRASVPADGTITAKSAPANATGVKFSAEKDTADPAGLTVDEAKGTVSVGDSQEGGVANIKATSDEGSFAFAPLTISEKPTTLDSTNPAAAATSARYGGKFKHTFTGKSGDKTKMEGANVNEKFDSLTADTPFGKFDLAANAAGSQGWFLDTSGEMTGPDNVSIDKSLIDARKFVKSAANPSPAKTLPVGFTMTQKLHAKSWPSGKLDGAPFTTAPHVRTLTADSGTLSVVITAGNDSVSFDYEGPPVYTNAAASQAKVVASPPKPTAKDATWDRTEVQVSADVAPTAAKLEFSLVGDKLGCEVDKKSGLVKIGATPGTIKVRASDGTTGHYDEVAIEITARPVEDPAKQSADGGGAGPVLEEPE